MLASAKKYPSPHGDEMQLIGKPDNLRFIQSIRPRMGMRCNEDIISTIDSIQTYPSPHGDEMQLIWNFRNRERSEVSVPAWG